MKKIEYTGYNSFSGGMKSNITPVSNSMLPTVVNGFKFLKGECNPCVALNDPRNYSCPFSINTGNGDNVSSIWDLLWKQTDGSYNSGSYNSGSSNSDKANTDSSPQTVNSYDVFLDKSKFPLLNELKDEVLLGSSFVNVNWKQLRDSVSIKTPDSGSSDKKKDKSSSSSKDKSTSGSSGSGSSGSNVPKFITNDSLYEDKNPYGTRPTNMY